ncbi:NAD(P)/FAD-dependent oxidoreductase [Oharaeibacter diazotrophicus]|uniref:Glycine/D-amino acid oxidase-like deaminating enzyme n=3 Tax=Oharaeibacter diazotrophicus TaxID=1920512 RepID=A0A4R6RJ51_9HYPH|nr:FAD-dependent oxidoreductase [Oharaeibacter diazotrophicus]TDP86424.1 glycine/D-amino acid oxidase-like deaminating enzyme [Oharaeibacter diazotrophicus]BBE71634.1 monomeric sarcosine oxidase [Pleomorphomonas sp. SM30]GLS78397.1 D-amino-acid oxidase [Oharaeibacter diazotrophicus]
MAGRPGIVVVGAGIVGAAIGRALARRGAAVTIVDAEPEVGGRATRASWAWINASWGNTLPYYTLRRASMAAWHALEREVPGLAVDWCGGLVWDLPPDELEAFAGDHAAWGYAIERLETPAIAALEPAIAPPPVAVSCPEEGVIDPVAATRALLDDAVAAGATLRLGTAVRRIATADGRVTGVEIDGGTVPADAVVLAAGTATDALAAPLGVTVPLRPAPGLVVRTRPQPPLVRRALIPPHMEVRQRADGSLLIAANLLDDDTDGARSAAHCIARAGELVSTPEPLVLDGWTVGLRPMPADGFPLVGAVAAVPGLHVAVTHSGVTLAAALGSMVAIEVLDGVRDPLLAPFALDRAMPA